MIRFVLGLVVLYLLAGWLLVGLPRGGECTSEQRAHDPDACGVGALIRKAMLWPLRLQ